MDSDPISVLERLYSAVVADVLDSMGHRHQCLSADIHALTPATKVCGRVFTAEARTVQEIPAEPYKLEMAAIDQMQCGDVLVVDAGHDTTSAFWGELLSTACKAKGVRGTVMSGCTRDLWALNQMEYPVFGIGAMPADSKGRLDVTRIGEPIALDGVVIKTGDYILGDLDGVVVIPSESAEEALRLALEKVSGENTVRDELAAGVPVSEVFAKHGIL
ncbi:MAG: RraA family protein [Verrucomicrobiae bacterium]|nr:RraA family protein [Verrucomicrobiae bacterium]MCB1086578.1 RraA family protein [Verrucomicrobiae bacterium]